MFRDAGLTRSRSGATVHREGCSRGKTAVHWDWADHTVNDAQLWLTLADMTWIHPCKTCFGGKDVTALAFGELMKLAER